MNDSCIHMNESWHTYEWVMVHIWTSHGTHMKESWHTYEWAMTHIWMSYGTHMNELWHTYKWVMVHKSQQKWGQYLIAIHGMHCWTVDCNALQCAATHWNTLQHTASHCNTLQHTATHGMVVPNSTLSVVVSRIHIAGYYTFTHTRTQTCIYRRNRMDVL